MNTTSRRVWVLADPHIGCINNDKDGAEWLALSINDFDQNISDVDFAVHLGDMTHGSLEEQLQEYVRIRNTSRIRTWYEFNGNHDHESVRNGLWAKWIDCPRYWSLIDGNTAWFSLPHERSNAAGLFLPEVEAWLRESITAQQDKNIIICSHSFPYDTVEFSTRVPRCMYPKAAVDAFLRDIRVDLWLGGHIHSRPRSTAASCRKGRTTFINAASVSHVYGTGACNSFVLEFTAGGSEVVAKCRNHDEQSWVEEQEVRIPLPHPWAGGTQPVFTGYPLAIPAHYGLMDEDEVESFA